MTGIFKILHKIGEVAPCPSEKSDYYKKTTKNTKSHDIFARRNASKSID